MSKWIKTLTYVGAIAGCSTLLGWSNYNVAPNGDQGEKAPALENFPLTDNQTWFVTESYLIMQPYQEDMDYATRLNGTGDTINGLDIDMRLKKPSFDWYSGARLGLGFYLPNHDEWDISFFTTFFYANEKNSTSPNIDEGAFLTTTWAVPNVPFDQGNVLWRMNYFTFDLSFGREFKIMETITAHPFIGARGALIYQKYKNVLTSSIETQFLSSILFLVEPQQTFKATNDYWGVGPRAGVDFRFAFKRNWSFLGGLSTSLLYGHYKVKENVVALSGFTASGQTLPFEVFGTETDSRYCIRGNLEGFIGLGWESWMNDNKVRVAPSILFEGSKWFQTNKLFTMGIVSTEARRRGHLSLMGFSVNLQVDF